MRPSKTFHGISLGVALLFAAGAWAKDDSVKLPLKFEKGRSYLFQIQFQPGAAFKAEPGKTGQPGATEPGQPDQPRQTGQSGQSGQPGQGQSETERERSTPTSGQTAGTAPAMAKTFNFKFLVQDTKDKETTLNVDLRCSGERTSGSTGERPSAATGESGRSAGTLTVKVDEYGRVMDIQGWDRLNWNELGFQGQSGQPSSAGQPGEPRESGQADQPREPGKQPLESGQPGQAREYGQGGTGQEAHQNQKWFRDAITAKLEMICGAGLHEKELEAGRYYYVRNPSESHHRAKEETGAPGTERSGTSGTERSGTSGTERTSTASSGQSWGMEHAFHTVLYRFDGSNKEGDREYARFTILVPLRSTPGTGESGQPPAARSRESGTSGASGASDDEALARAGWKKVGEAAYVVKDGLVENLNMDFMGASKAGFSSPETRGPTLSIRRIEGMQPKSGETR